MKGHVITRVAVLGRAMLVPGIQPVRVLEPDGNTFVSHAYPDRIVRPDRDLTVDVSDCTVYTIEHLDWEDTDFESRDVVDRLFEQALQAISELLIWNKVLDKAIVATAFSRQIGRLDVKYFFIEYADTIVAWKNPLFTIERKAAGVVAGFLRNMVVQNGPAANQLSGPIRRAMAALDLLNLGFYTESFVSVFALADDLTQEVMMAGMAKKGLDQKAQKDLLRAIKEERLKTYLTKISVLCDWRSVEADEPELFQRMTKANKLRNNIMHGSARLGRAETLLAVNAMLDTIDWLRKNPFGYVVPEFPILQLAQGDFLILDRKASGEPSSAGQIEQDDEK